MTLDMAIMFLESHHFIRSYCSVREDGVTILLSNNAYASVGCIIKGMLLKDKFILALCTFCNFCPQILVSIKTSFLVILFRTSLRFFLGM